jgi:integral membrane protein
MTKAFRRYRALSFITGTTLLILCATALLHAVNPTAWHHIYWFVKVIGVGHGIVLYPIYMVTCFNLVLRHKLNLALLGLMLFAGFIPGLAFYLEYRIAKRLYPQTQKLA